MSARKHAISKISLGEGDVVHRLFESQVRNTPEATAIRVLGEATSYESLNERSNRIAHGLLRRGLESGHAVAVMLEDGTAQIAALLGVFKAGGVIVCLDSEHPAERLRYILGDAVSGKRRQDQRSGQSRSFRA